MDQVTINTRPSIFEYTEYRAYLRDLFHFKKHENPSYSYRVFSRMSGFQSPNVLKLVIDGKRNIAAVSTTKFARGLSLTKTEALYFADLIQFNQEEDLEKKSHFARQLLRTRNLSKIHPLKAALFRYYSRWYFVAIRELVAHPKFEASAQWILKHLQPKISESQANEALRELQQLGMIHQNEYGKWLQTEALLNTANEIPSLLVAQFHREMIRLGAESIDRFKTREREISSVSAFMSDPQFQEAKVLIQKLRGELLALAVPTENQDNGRVYQINFQVFPLSTNETDESSGAKK